MRLPFNRARVSEPFGPRTHPVTGKPDMHNGVDFVIFDRMVYASHDGTVLVKTTENGGNEIHITNGDYETVYIHLSEPIVNTGDRVGIGQLIAIQGDTGRVTGEHLHFGIKYKGVYINPAEELLFRNEIGSVIFTQFGVKHYHELNCKGVAIHDMRINEGITRGEVFALLNQIVKER